MKVFVCEFSQETNSFCPVISVREDFGEWDGGGTKKEVHGFIDVMLENGYEVVKGPMYRAQASGPVMQEVVDQFLAESVEGIKAAGALDAVCVELHGSTQSTKSDNVCGEIVRALREAAGNVPVAASCDLHANITDLLYENADFISTYQTYPHRDAYETGRRSAELCVRKLKGEQVCSARAVVPMIVPASGYTTEGGEFGKVVEKARALVKSGEIFDYSICVVQPWLDVYECNSAVLVYAADQETAVRHAQTLAQGMAECCEKMHPEVSTVDEIIQRAREKKDGKPVVVSDFSDSPNAGAAGDNVDILAGLLERGSELKAAVIVNDIPATDAAFACGVGNKATFRIGGTLAPHYSKPVEAEGVVRSLHDGKYILGGPMMRGVEMDIGRAAVVTIGNVDVLLCHTMRITGDIQLYRHFGIEPSFYQVVVVKANTSFKAVYAAVSEDVASCDTGCASTADLVSLPWKHLPKEGMYPFVSLDGYRAEEHTSMRQL